MDDRPAARIAPAARPPTRRSRRRCRARASCGSRRSTAAAGTIRANRRGYWSFWIFMVLFVLCLFAEFIANDRPILASYKGEICSRSSWTIRRRSSAASWRRPTIAIRSSPRRSRRTAGPSGRRSASPTTRINLDLPDRRARRRRPGCSPRSVLQADRREAAVRRTGTCRDLEWNWLGTDDGGRDVLARVIYGFRISVLFGLILAGISSVIGITAGAVQGYFGGGSTSISSASSRSGRRSRRSIC